jgi:hypothetical protein
VGFVQGIQRPSAARLQRRGWMFAVQLRQTSSASSHPPGREDRRFAGAESTTEDLLEEVKTGKEDEGLN